MFDAFVELLDSDGLLTAARLDASAEDLSPVVPDGDAALAAEEDDDVVARGGRRALSPKQAIFMVLFRCRVGLDIIDLHKLFGVGYSEACKCVPYLSARPCAHA